MKDCSYLSLFLTFARVGGLTFGGGYAMLPMLQREIVNNKKWATEEELLDYYAVSQCTPGVIAVNVATFIGSKCKGTLGGIAATLGVVAPSFFIILAVAAFLKNFAENAYVSHALAGIRVAVAALVINAVVGLWKKSVKGIVGIAMFAAVFLLSLFTPLSPIWIVVAAIILGIAYGHFFRKSSADKPKSESSKASSDENSEDEGGAK